MSLTVSPSRPWDLERMFYGNPLLTKTERLVAIRVLKTWHPDTFEPIASILPSQTLVGHWIGAWRSTVCRALRQLVALGYFRVTWVTVQKLTKQGIKGVTRVMVSPGPEVDKLIHPPEKTADQLVLPGQVLGVTSTHTSRTHQGENVAVGSGEIANSADRSGSTSADEAETRRKTLANWPRLAGAKPILASNLPSAVPFAELAVRTDGAELAAYTELDEDERAARLQAARQKAARAAELAQRQQPRRLPRSRRT